ncbi:MAG: hypothetical protein GXP55_06770, partial [Deltaproteobacteria bacterium]|nr:hypothetical protein [Deltaproteobacteria bacterium]
DLQARLHGYVDQRFVLSSLTVAEQLKISLVRERTRRRGGGRRPHPQPAAMTEAPPPPVMMTSMRRHGLPQSEVLDPWATGG